MHSLACLTFGWLNFALPASVRWRLAPCTWALREGLGFAWLIGDVWKRLHHPGKCGTAGNLRGKGQAGPSVEQCQISTLKTLTYSCRRLHSLGRQLVFASLKAFPRNKSCQTVLHWANLRESWSPSRPKTRRNVSKRTAQRASCTEKLLRHTGPVWKRREVGYQQARQRSFLFLCSRAHNTRIFGHCSHSAHQKQWRCLLPTQAQNLKPPPPLLTSSFLDRHSTQHKIPCARSPRFRSKRKKVVLRR